ncbi:MAG: hypothetical protein HY300_06115 [Verrucomicrobia bacterium]|nr:hypothetical protein [Verrucomicrobiota bacterium]
MKRSLVQLGYNQPLEGRGPIAANAYLYYNQPGWSQTNLTLRLAIAPGYVDGELGFAHLLGPQTDFAIGLAGGGFADSFSEVRGGHFFQEESFTGHGGEVSASVYHLFNPGDRIPLNAVLRGGVHYSSFERDDRTAPGFVLPDDHPTYHLRAGLRFGGREPVLTPDAAMEISLWYDGQIRDHYGLYGFGNDRVLEHDAHLFWGRALLALNNTNTGRAFTFNITAGTSANADRFSSFRLGAALPLAAEFPLNLPGYYFEEISAHRFVLVGGSYAVALDERQHWHAVAFGTTAAVDYLNGFSQPGNWHTGVGGGIAWESRTRVWQVQLGYGYGVDAIRDGHRGANSIGIVVQYDLGAARSKRVEFPPGTAPEKSRFLDRFLRIFGG